MNDERPPSLWRGMWLRFADRRRADRRAERRGDGARSRSTDRRRSPTELFPASDHIATPKGLVTETESYSAGPQNFLVLGSDRRAGSKNAEERERRAAQRHDPAGALRPRTGPDLGAVDPARPDGQHPHARTGQLYPNEKINAAYTIGSELEGHRRRHGAGRRNDRAGSLPRTERAPQRHHRRQLRGLHQGRRHAGLRLRQRRPPLLGGGASAENFSAINLQPGYQKLCYENALSYVRFRHFDSDFVRVARQQDFMRDLREQISPSDVLGRIDTGRHGRRHRRSGRTSGRPVDDAQGTGQADRLLADQAAAPGQVQDHRRQRAVRRRLVRDLDSRTGESNAERLPHGREQVHVSAHSTQALGAPPRGRPARAHSAGTLGLTATTGESEAVKAALSLPFQVLYPTLQTRAGQPGNGAALRAAQPAEQAPPRLRRRLAPEHARRLLRLRGHRLAEPAAVRPRPHADDRRAQLHDWSTTARTST